MTRTSDARRAALGAVAVFLTLALSLRAQEGAGRPASAPPRAEAVAANRARPSDAARSALAEARELAAAVRGQNGPERDYALEQAAKAFDAVAARFAAEPPVVAEAAWTAAGLWRRQGSLALAEQDYLAAAAADAGRYAQRALLGAADMQRRQQRTDEAMATYARAAAVDQRTVRAQEARLWQARMLLAAERFDDAIRGFQAALESAPSPSQAIATADWLAQAWLKKGDLDAAERAIAHAGKVVADAGDGDPVAAARLSRAFERMPARKALQRARDAQNDAAGDAVRLDAHRRANGQH